MDRDPGCESSRLVDRTDLCRGDLLLSRMKVIWEERKGLYSGSRCGACGNGSVGSVIFLRSIDDWIWMCT